MGDFGLNYLDLYQNIARSADIQTKEIDLPEQSIEWKINLFIDTSYSGKAINFAK